MKNSNDYKMIESANLAHNVYKQSYSDLESKIINILKLLKSSEIPFILYYFPKIGGEFSYYLFINKPIELKKVFIDTWDFQYIFVLANKDEYLS